MRIKKSLMLIEEGAPELHSYDWDQYDKSIEDEISKYRKPAYTKNQIEVVTKFFNQKEKYDYNLREFALNDDVYINIISIQDVLHIAQHTNLLLKEVGLPVDHKSPLRASFLGLPATSVLKSHPLSKSKEYYQESLLLSINLAQASDEDILNELKVEIGEWRKLLATPEPPAIKSRNGDKIKIIKYEIFPLIDILSWAKANNVEIKPSVFMVKLFPHGEYGSKEFTDYISGFMKKVLDDAYTLV
jgi:hypothetical protein